MKVTDVLRARGVGVGKKLTGNAVAGDVRAGKTFLNVNGEATGTLPVQATGVQTITPTTTNIVKAAGIYDGAITVEGDADLVTANIKAGVNIFGVAGKSQVVDTTEATVPIAAATVLAGKKGFVNGALITGTMTDRAAVTITPSNADQAIAAGYHNGSGKVLGDTDLIAANIKAGVNIFGVTGAASVVDTTEAVGTAAAASHLLSGRNAYVNGAKVVGTMVDRGAMTLSPGPTAVTIPAGYHNGSGTVAGDADLLAGNIRAGVNIFGVDGKTEVIDTTEALGPAGATQILIGRSAYVNGARVTGTMADRGGAATITPGTSNIVKAAGYYSGAQTITGDADLVTANIKAGVNIFGVAGKSSVVDTADATAVAAEMLAGDTAYVNGVKVTGTAKDVVSTAEKTELVTAVNDAEAGSNQLIADAKVDLAAAIGAPVTAASSFGTMAAEITEGRRLVSVAVGSPTAASDTLRDMATDIDAVKVKLAPKVGGVTTESLDSLADKVANLSVRRVKTGTVTNSTTSQNFSYVGTGTVAIYFVTVVEDLGFIPSVIYLISREGTANSRLAFYTNKPGDMYAGPTVRLGSFIPTVTNASTYLFKGDVAPVSVTAQGFVIPALLSGATYDWVALE